MKENIIIGTRSSKLAISQTSIVADLIKKHFPEIIIKMVPIKTLGDRVSPERRALLDGKVAFTKDIEKRLLNHQIDIAVHSMKDLPSELDERLTIGATPPREDPRDALVTYSSASLSELPKNAKIGTSSLRRKAQLLQLRSDLEIHELHGNVETRIRKLNALGLDGIVLAAAGLKRIGEIERISQIFGIDEMIPAVGQGVLAVEIRKDDTEIKGILSKIDDKDTRIAVECERAFASRLGGDCYVPIAAHALPSNDLLKITGMIAEPHGINLLKDSMVGQVSNAKRLGAQLAKLLLECGGKSILETVAV
jgi:hydroxymethylbilane synthase